MESIRLVEKVTKNALENERKDLQLWNNLILTSEEIVVTS